MAECPSRGRVVIVGAGPTGLGAAERLQQLGYPDWLLLEQAPEPGGLSRSFRDAAGFTWDIGGHVVFSHYPEFTALLDRVALTCGWERHERAAWIRVSGTWVPYPFQRNLHRLPPAQREACLEGLRRCATAPADHPPAHFGEFLTRSFGDGLCAVFMRPYNRKVWAVEPEAMDWRWIGDRVAPVDAGQIEEQVARGRDDLGWGPNNTFRFPADGGTGAIWHALAATLDAERTQFGARVTGLDLSRQEVLLDGGERVAYDWLISTMPLDQLCKMSGVAEWADLAGSLGHNTVSVVGLGLEGDAPAQLAQKSWMYFPEDNTPFFRVTHFSHYSARNAPVGHWSLLCETAATPGAERSADEAIAATLAGAQATGLLRDTKALVSTWHHVATYGYPQPLLGRDALLRRLLPSLAEMRILSRGRFGAWHYEVGNMDHSYMQGRESVERILFGATEPTLHSPATVNAQRVPS